MDVSGKWLMDRKLSGVAPGSDVLPQGWGTGRLGLLLACLGLLLGSLMIPLQLLRSTGLGAAALPDHIGGPIQPSAVRKSALASLTAGEV